MRIKYAGGLASITLALVAALAVPAAAAQDLTAGDWKFRAQIYGWFPSINAETQFPPPANGATANVDASNYMDSLQSAFMGTLEARKGKLGLLTDYIYLNFDADKSGTRDLTLTGPLGRVDLPVGATADVGIGLRGWAWSLAGTYTAVENPRYEMQVLGGLRYLKIDTTVSWRLNGNIGSLPPVVVAGASTGKPDYWDAIVGVRGRARLGDGNWFVPYYADVGTGQSDLTWQALVGVGYAFDWGEVTAAYRHLSYKFDSASPLRDLSFTGPAIAVGFRW